ncbi:unnamed protein product, partial [Ectocarpus sp. 8 AP-2014]
PRSTPHPRSLTTTSTLLSQQSFSSRPTTHPPIPLHRINDNKKMPSIATLNYFGLPGRGEATRVALAYAGKDFEDNRMGFPEYGACKWAGKGLPVLEMDDAEYTQSTAPLRYAGKLGGLYPDAALA